jgi:hypothetical protein
MNRPIKIKFSSEHTTRSNINTKSSVDNNDNILSNENNIKRLEEKKTVFPVYFIYLLIFRIKNQLKIY